MSADDRLPTDNTIRTRLWDADFNLRYDSGLPGAVDVETATRNLLGIYEPLHVTHDSLGWGRWCGRVRLDDNNQIEYVSDYEYLTKMKFADGGIIQGSSWAENETGEPIKIHRIGQVLQPNGTVMCEYAHG